MKHAPDDTFVEAYYQRPDAVWPDFDEPELPWAWALADWLYDPVSGRFASPWPKDDPLEDRRWNLFPVLAMETVSKAFRLFRVPEAERSEKQRTETNDFMTEIIEGLEP